MTIDRKETAKHLRSLARKIERGEVELKSVTTLNQARNDRFPVSQLHISTSTKRK